MKSQVSLVTILIIVIVTCSLSIPSIRSQPYYDAWFTHIYVTNGNDEIDLINGGTAKIYDGQLAVKKLTLYNHGCGSWGADLYTRIYRNTEHVGTSSETYVSKGSSDTDEFSATLSGPATYSYKVELWWENWGEHLLVDEKQFSINVVKIWVSNWSSSELSVERGFESGKLDITLSNGGTDLMYYVSLLVIDTSGLTITPITPVLLGHIAAGGTKTKTFTVGARGDMDPMDYSVTFRITYDDLRGVAHTETFQANVTVSSNIIRENLTYILVAVVIVSLCLAAIILYIKRRKPKQVETTEP
jgi:hypothetical protein